MVALFSVVVLAAASASRASVLSARQNCDSYVVDGIPGAFAERIFVDFTAAQAGGDPAAFLANFGMSISNYGPVPSTPIPHSFSTENVALGDGALEVTVNAYDNSGNVIGGEIVTNDRFLYGSMRTVLKSSGTPGIVEGMFYYLSDTQESDWEILTTTALEPSVNIPAGIWATNQALVEGEESTHVTVPFTFDPSQDFHEYRIDWTAEATVFYIDGEQKARLTENVPTDATLGVWNMWSSGDPYWSAGPPTADSVTSIRSIDLYKGYIPEATGNTCEA